MKDMFVLDACAMIALLANEEGAQVVKSLVQSASDNQNTVVMHKLNFLEVYYEVLRSYGQNSADELVAEMKNNPVTIISEISDDVFLTAGRLKASYKISLADSIALAQAVALNAAMVTSDHHELDIVEKQEPIEFLWIR